MIDNFSRLWFCWLKMSTDFKKSVIRSAPSEFVTPMHVYDFVIGRKPDEPYSDKWQSWEIISAILDGHVIRCYQRDWSALNTYFRNNRDVFKNAGEILNLSRIVDPRINREGSKWDKIVYVSKNRLTRNNTALLSDIALLDQGKMIKVPESEVSKLKTAYKAAYPGNKRVVIFGYPRGHGNVKALVMTGEQLALMRHRFRVENPRPIFWAKWEKAGMDSLPIQWTADVAIDPSDKPKAKVSKKNGKSHKRDSSTA